MKTLTLRQKFTAGLATVFIVAAVVAWGNSLMGKSARLHYDERNHLAHIMRVDAALALAAHGAAQAELPSREELLKEIDGAIEIHVKDNAALNDTERLLFRVFGYGDVLDLADRGAADLAKIRTAIAGAPGDGVNAELSTLVGPYMTRIYADSVRWGEVLAESIRFFNLLMSVLTFACLAMLGLTFFLLRRSVLGPVDLAVGQAQKIAAGDLRGQTSVCANDEIGSLLQALNDMNDNLVRIAGKVRHGADTVRSVVGEVIADNAQLASRTESQDRSLKKIASSMDVLTAGVKENAGHAEHANQQVTVALDTAGEGRRAIAKVISSMSEIMESSKRIADITQVIDGIAFQTNILALNAAVESASAGEYGKGFAVIAAEVRNLAQRSAVAAKEIRQLISDSSERVLAGAALVDQARETMNRISDSIGHVSDIMGSIAAAGQGQSAGIEQVNRGLMLMGEFTRQNAMVVDQAVAGAENLEQEANALAEAVDIFRLDEPAAAASQHAARMHAAVVPSSATGTTMLLAK